MANDPVSQAQQGQDQDASAFPTKKGKKGSDSEAAQQIVSWAKNSFQTIKSARSKQERQWYLNMCFYRGSQNIAVRNANTNIISGVNGYLYVPPAPYWRVRPVINRIRPIIRGELSRLTSQKPTAYIIPSSSDDRDLFAAQAGEQLWESIYRSHNLPSIMRRVLWWNQVCGTAFLKAAWDPDKVDTESDQQGNFSYEVVNPFFLFIPDLREEDIEDQPYVIHAQLKTKDWVQINYPKAKFAGGDQSNDILDESWLDIVGAQNIKQRATVLCLECWIKPGKIAQFPDGGVYTVVGDTLVQNTPGWPYQHGRYPFAKLSHIPTGKFYSESSIVDLIPLQREYNRTRGQVIEAKNRMAKPQLLAERGSIDPGRITSEPGQVIEFQPGFNPPVPLQLPNLPAYVIQELDRLLMDMNDISGQHEVSKGQVPPGVTAATAINFLQEQDDSTLSYTFSALEEAYEKIAFMTLSYIQQFWDAPRIVRVVGQDGFFDSMTFKGSDLRGNNDIKVEAGSALPISKSAKQAFIMDLMKMGFIDPATGLEVMEMGGISKIYEAVQVDARQAQRENLRLAQIDDETYQAITALNPQQMVVPVNSFDNHAIHIQAHNKYRKGQSFETLSDSAKQAFEQHVQMHVSAMMTAQMGTNPIEMMKSGGPDNNQAQPGAQPNQSSPGQEPATNDMGQ